jgi:ADP-ribosyl-[dinitrogen reductase] hydrolase
MASGLYDRILGAVFGTAIGDSLLAYYEDKKSDWICADLWRRKGLHYFDYIDPWVGKRQMPAGHPTDDSELSAALAYSLIEYPQFNEEDCYQRLRSFIHGRKSILTDDEAYGSGGTLRSALQAPDYQKSLLMFEWGGVRMLPSNGSLMRCIAVPVRHYNSLPDLVDLARKQSMITHRHDDAVASCIAYSVMTGSILNGFEPSAAWIRTRQLLFREPYASMPRLPQVLDTEMVRPTEEEIWPHSGGAVLSLRIAVWATMNAKDFRDGLTKIVELGGDTDTYGAIAGGMMGAHFGFTQIPEEWRETVLGKDRLTNIANGLYDLANP